MSVLYPKGIPPLDVAKWLDRCAHISSSWHQYLMNGDGGELLSEQVWEWTSTAFYPYPGFVPDFPYRENSCPWFGYRKVVKGGCWATSAPIVRGGYRHSFWPNMDAVFTGFRMVYDR